MKISYDTRLIAFIDVMGFKKALRKLEVLNRYFRKCHEHLGHKGKAWQEFQPEADLQTIMISDSIILSVLMTGDKHADLRTAANFFNTIGLLQYVLAVQTCTWTRGAISIGDVCIKKSENILVGQGFVDAFNLERAANYPRVIVDPKVAAHLGYCPNEMVQRCNGLTYLGKLLEMSREPRVGEIPFTFDAIQIDWFRWAFERDENLSAFFKDLRERMCEDHELFSKSNKLLKYIRESLGFFGESGAKTERMKLVANELERLGY